nr:immunoglobulin heavy chain junction region [Mus musculus]MBK4186310.1 immunoglobulin heavy chain junction region [Mus musculus]
CARSRFHDGRYFDYW